MTQRHPARSLRTLGVAAISAGLLFSVAGCGGTDESLATLEQARRTMRAMHAGDDSPTPQMRERVYRETINSLRGVVDRLSPAHSASALLLLGQAEAGLAELSAARAAEIERRALNRLSDARTALESFASQSAKAEALLRYSPDEQRATFRAQEQALDQEAARANEARRTLEERIASIEAVIAQQKRLAADERAREREIWTSVADAGAQARAEAAARAQQVARRADAYEREAAEQEAQVNLLRPQVTLLDTDIARVRRQRELIDIARKDLDTRVAALRAQAAQVRGEAAGAAQRLEQVLREMQAQRTSDLAAAHDAAASGFNNAIGTYRRAASALPRTESRPPISLAMASAQQTLAHMHASRAALEGALVDFLTWTNNVQPPPPQIVHMRELRADAQAQRQRSVSAAVDAYQAALSTLQGVNVRGDVGERIERLRAQVNDALRALGAGVAEEPAATEPMQDWTDDPADAQPMDDDPAWDDGSVDEG